MCINFYKRVVSILFNKVKIDNLTVFEFTILKGNRFKTPLSIIVYSDYPYIKHILNTFRSTVVDTFHVSVYGEPCL